MNSCITTAASLLPLAKSVASALKHSPITSDFVTTPRRISNRIRLAATICVTSPRISADSMRCSKFIGGSPVLMVKGLTSSNLSTRQSRLLLAEAMP